MLVTVRWLGLLMLVSACNLVAGLDTLEFDGGPGGTGGSVTASGGTGGSGTGAGGASNCSTDWWDATFATRRPITIDAGAEAVPAGYSVGLTVAKSELADTPPYDGVRIAHCDPSSGWSELDRVIDETTTTLTLWFRLQGALAANGSDTSHFLYTDPGSSPGPAPADGSAVFELYDDFDGTTLDAQRWVAIGNPSLAGGQLTLDASDNGDHSILSSAVFGHDHAVEAIMQVTTVANYSWVGFQNDFVNDEPYIVWMASAVDLLDNTLNDTMRPLIAIQAAGVPNNDSTPALPDTLDGLPHRYGIERHRDVQRFFHDDSEQGQFIFPTAYEADMHVRLNADSGAVAVYDWVRVRRQLTVGPSASLGAEQTQ